MAADSDPEFAVPAPPKKRSNNMSDFLQDDADEVYISGGFSGLQKLPLSTSTPCPARMISRKQLHCSPDDSGFNDSLTGSLSDDTLMSSDNSSAPSLGCNLTSNFVSSSQWTRSRSSSVDSAYCTVSSGMGLSQSQESMSEDDFLTSSGASSVFSFEERARNQKCEVSVPPEKLTKDISSGSFFAPLRHSLSSQNVSLTPKDESADGLCHATSLDNLPGASCEVGARIQRSFMCSTCVQDKKYTNTTVMESQSLPGIQNNVDLPVMCAVCQNFQKQLQAVVKCSSPSVPGMLIGRKMGLEHFDIIQSLWQRDTHSLELSRIVQYLDTKTLQVMSMVSPLWANIVKPSLTVRLKQDNSMLAKRTVPKENDCAADKHQVRNTTESAGILQKVQALAGTKVWEPPSPKKEMGGNFNNFLKVGETLRNGQSLRKCPKCMKPSPTFAEQEKCVCSSIHCGFVFCMKCLYEYHGSKSCPSVTRTCGKPKMSTKQSRKNLRRL